MSAIGQKWSLAGCIFIMGHLRQSLGTVAPPAKAKSLAAGVAPFDEIVGLPHHKNRFVGDGGLDYINDLRIEWPVQQQDLHLFQAFSRCPPYLGEV